MDQEELDFLNSISGGGSADRNSWWEDFGDSFMVTEFAQDAVERFSARRRGSGRDPDFDPYANDYLKGYEKYLKHFSGVQNREEAEAIKRTIDLNNARRDQMNRSGRWFPQLAGAIAADAPLLLVPGGTGRTLAMRAAKTGAYIGASEMAVELVARRPLDPTRTDAESVSTVLGGALIGGSFHYVGGSFLRGANRLANYPKVQAAQARVNQQIAQSTGTHIPLTIGDNEGLYAALRSSGFEGDVPIFREDRPVNNKTTANAISVNASSTQKNMLEFFDVIESVEKSTGTPVMDASDPLVQAIRKARKGRKGVKSYQPVWDLMDERLKRGDDLMDIYAVRVPDPAVRAQVQNVLTAAKTSADVRFDLIRQLGRPTQDGFIQYNEQGMRQGWDALKQTHNGSPDTVLVQKGLKPLSDFGITGFQNFEEYREFILRHELWHQALGSRNYNKKSLSKKKKTSQQYRDEENAANENAARDFLEWRDQNFKLHKVAYKGAMMQRADAAFNGALSAGQTKVADWFQLRASNSPHNVVYRRAKTQDAHDTLLTLTGDHSLIPQAQRAGRNIGTSVQTGSKVWLNEAVTSVKRLEEIYAKFAGKPEKQRFLYVSLPSVTKTADYHQFLDEVGRTLMAGTPHPNTHINEAVREVNRFYEWSLKEVQSAGMLHDQTGDGIRSALREITMDMQSVEDDMFTASGGDPDITPLSIMTFNPQAKVKDRTWQKIHDFMNKNPEFYRKVKYLSNKRSQLIDDEAYIKSMSGQEANDYMRRVYNTAAIQRHRDHFTEMVYQSYLRSPKIWVKGKGWVDGDPRRARERAEETVRKILGEDDVEHRFGGGPGAMRHRQVPLTNNELTRIDVNGEQVDFIHVDPAANMINYARNVGSYAEFAKRFRSNKSYKSPDEVFQERLAEIEKKELAAGNDPKTVKKIIRDLYYLKRASMHRISTAPDSMNREVVSFLKNYTHLTTMGMSGITALNELSSIWLHHGLGRLMKAVHTNHGANLGRFMERHQAEMARMGAQTDITLGVANQRWGDNVYESSLRTKPNKIANTLASKMFIFNGMGPLTMFNKSLTGTIVIDRTLGGIADEFNVRGWAGKRTDDVAYVQHMMPRAIRSRIANMLEENWDDIYLDDEGVFVVDTREWSDTRAARAFQEHRIAEIENVVLMTNPSTKWKVMDGIVHLPRNKLTDKLYGKHPDVRLDGEYYAINNPYLSLPFMYMSWPLSAANKVMGRMVRNEYAAPLGFMVASMAMSYFVQEFKGFVGGKNRHFISLDDKLFNAFYYSNMSNILIDYYDRTSQLGTAVARDMGYEDFDMRVPNLRFLDVESGGRELFDQATGPAVLKQIDAMQGLFGDDFGGVRRNIPFNQMPFFAQLYNAIETALEE